MFEYIYRCDPANPTPHPLPATPAEAIERIETGNREFALLVQKARASEASWTRVVPLDLEDVGRGLAPGEAPEQKPFGIVLSCADARVPVEMVLGQAVNDLFVVRVAGNVLGSESLGSIDYAAHHFTGSLRLLVVLGHSLCGAVAATVKAFLEPALYFRLAAAYPLRSIVDRILVTVQGAARSLEAVYGRAVADQPGYRRALLDLSVAFNTAQTAYSLREELPPDIKQGVTVVFGVYDLASRRVVQPQSPDLVALAEPPAGAEEFKRFALTVAGSEPIRRALSGGT